MNPRPLVYLDNNATTRVAPEVLEAMLPFLSEQWGNPSSAYHFGKAVARQVEAARAQVAALIGAVPEDIVFTSGGTESINAALLGALTAQPRKRHLVTTTVEHSASLKVCAALEQRGWEVTLLPVACDGSLELARLEQSIRPDTALVSVMWANNETGVVFPIEEIAAICQRHRVPLHTDAVQAAGKLQINVASLGVDYLSLSAHKLHAPKGIGLLYLRRGAPFQPWLLGGGQERGRRGGTLNVPYIVGFGRAAEWAGSRLADVQTHVRALRDQLERRLIEAIPAVSCTGATQPRLPNTSHVSFEGLTADALLLMLDQAGICASTGSACAAGSLEPSHVLTAMGLEAARARSCVRFSLGFYNTADDVDYLLQHLPGMVARLRAAARDD